MLKQDTDSKVALRDTDNNQVEQVHLVLQQSVQKKSVNR